MSNEKYKAYWDANIEDWAQLYLDISHGHETLNAWRWFSKLYSSTIGRHERALMKERYRITVSFLDKVVQPGVIFSDIGCGTGIFTVEALRRGAYVNAIDFSESSLKATKRNVETKCPEFVDRVTYYQLDVAKEQLPKSDFAIIVGVAPYIKDVDFAVVNLIKSTNTVMLQYCEKKNWQNRLRIAIPFLNVRNLIFWSSDEVDAITRKERARVVSRQAFATGFMDIISSEGN